MSMSRPFRIYLAITGVAATIAVVLPPLVWVGVLLGILPGLFLMVAPSLFLYSIAWWAVQALVLQAAESGGFNTNKRVVRLAAGVTAIAIVALPAIQLPRFFNSQAENMASGLRVEDIESNGRIEIPEVVAVVLAREPGNDGLCETLCQRLLFNHAASRVIVAERPTQQGRAERPARAFWIERRDNCPTPPLSRREVVWPIDQKQSGSAIVRVRARIAAGECLLGKDNASIESADLSIAYSIPQRGPVVFPPPWKLKLDQMKVNRLEITANDGRVLYRRTGVEAQPLMTPLLIASLSSFMTTVRYFGWARTVTIYSELDVQGRDVLPSLLGEVTRAPDWPALLGPK
jgi:hypothetical protein